MNIPLPASPARACICTCIRVFVFALLLKGPWVMSQTVCDFVSAWKFNIPTADPGTAWKELTFDDSIPLNGVNWGGGAGLLGFETGALPAPGLQTAVGVANSAPVTYLFRRSFYFDGDPDDADFAIDHVADDGVTYYLNGNPLGSVRHIPGVWNNVATGGPSNAIEEPNVVLGKAATLRHGQNVLAAEVHQTGPNGSDMVFGARFKITAKPLASDRWRLLNFGSSGNSGNGADIADPDGDGMNNFVEYALSKDPLKQNHSWGMAAAQGANLTLTYSRRKAALAEATFTALWATNLGGTWSSTGVTEQILSDDGAIQVVQAQVPSSGERVFLKVQLTRLPITVPGTAPSSLVATPVSATQVNLAWADNSTNETNFKIERKSGSESFVEIETVPANVRNFSDSGLITGTTYIYRIRANNSAGDSPYSSEVSATTLSLPAAPGNLNGTVISGTQINLTWSDGSNNETGFSIERRPSGGTFAEIATRGAGVTNYQDTSITQGVVYIYRVRAYNVVGYSAYTLDERIAADIPAAPDDAVVTVGAATRIDLTWVDNATNESGYKIERRVSGGTFAPLGTSGIDTTGFQDSTVTAGIQYIYRVRATNVIGDSGYSAEARITAGPPAVPSGLSALVVTNTRVDLAWSDDSDNETQFKIERRISGGSFAPLATVGAGVTSYQDNTLTSGVTYIYRIRASNAGGDSAYTADARVTAGPPATPTTFAASAIAHNQIRLTWTDVSNSEALYRIERKTGAAAFAEIATMPANSNAYLDVTVSPSTAYTYRILATNAAGSSSYSTEASATTPAAPPAPTGWKVRQALGMYFAEETMRLIPVAQPDGTVKIRDTVPTVVPSGYQKYYLINESLHQGELENSGSYQPYTKLTIVKVIARGNEMWRIESDYFKQTLGGAAEVFTGTRP